MLEKERSGFNIIFDYINKVENKNKLKSDDFILVFEKKTFNAKYYTETWMDNGLKETDPNYKEFQAIYFVNVANNKFIEITELKSPLEVYLNGEKIY